MRASRSLPLTLAAAAAFALSASPALAAKAPTVVIEPVTEVGDHTATFNGEVNPQKAETNYRFEDSSDGGKEWTELEEFSLPKVKKGKKEVPGDESQTVTQTVGELAGNSTYHVRLFAHNSEGTSISGEEKFSTLAAPPQVSGVGATGITAGEATLYATIRPENEPTTYRFEYGPTTAYGTAVPAGEGDAGSTPTQVSQTLQGLAPATTYHYRVVATNATGTTDGVDRKFTTPAKGEPVPAGSCPNEALRGESDVDPLTGVAYSLALPDCRAYEQVTPPFKSFNNVVSGAPNLATASTTAISASGSQLLEDSVPLMGDAGADEELVGTYYELGRGISGWTATSLTAAASVFPISHEELASPSDVAVGLWAAGTPSQSVYAEDFYLREADGTFLNIGPIAPASATAGPPRGAEPRAALAEDDNGIVGSSADLSDVVFQLDSPYSEGGHSYLWPGDGTALGRLPSLYEYVGVGHSGEGAEVPALVGVDNAGGQISECGTGLGADVKPEAHAVHNGVSAGGSTVFFNAAAGGCVTGATGPAASQLYARIGAAGTTQATVNVAGSSGCASSVSCNVTSPVAFQGASSDGSRVFFTAAQAGLIAGDTDATNALYECELPGDGGATPTPTGLVDACPDLRAISLTGTSSGANVQGVVAVSEEGSRVYFTATGVLSSEPDLSLPAGHQVAEAGKANLYVWEAPGEGDPAGYTSFIATLPEASPKEAQATPDGRYLVFTTTADLTSDDTSTAAQAFRYDAQTGELIRVSVGQGGFNNDGNTSSDPATLASTGLERLTASEDGSYIVFQSNDALTPQVHGGLNNVYEWHDGNVYLISDGTDASHSEVGGFQITGLIGIDASGQNIFFVTADQLVGQDTDEDYDVYDARIDGGFPAPTPAANCSGEACQGPLSGSSAPPLPGGSTAPPAIGNLTPAAGGVLAVNTTAGASTGKVQITKHSVKGSTVTLSVKAPAEGAISVSGSGLQTVKRSVLKAASYTLKLTLTKAGKASLRKDHRLKVKIKVAFNPTSGEASSEVITVTVKM